MTEGGSKIGLEPCGWLHTPKAPGPPWGEEAQRSFILFVQDEIRSGLPLLASCSISHFCLSFKVQSTGWNSEYREVQLRGGKKLQCGSRASILFFTSWEPVGMFDFAIFIVFQKVGFGHRNRCFPQASLWFFLVVP